MGGISPYIGEHVPRYCHWHYVCLRMRAHEQTFEEFERWNLGWRRYCSVENHYPLPDLWDAIHGKKLLDRENRDWCGLIDCKHYSIVQTAQWYAEGHPRCVGYGDGWGFAKPSRGRRQTKEQGEDIKRQEQELWTPKTILARQKLGMQVQEVPF